MRPLFTPYSCNSGFCTLVSLGGGDAVFAGKSLGAPSPITGSGRAESRDRAERRSREAVPFVCIGNYNTEEQGDLTHLLRLSTPLS